MKDLLRSFPEPKPKTTTVATLLKRMIDKDFVATLSLVTQRILSISTKTAYFSKHVNGLIKFL
jgi:predicted transcriptional regulator